RSTSHLERHSFPTRRSSDLRNTMEAFTVHKGIGVPLRRSNVDTDQIIPAVYLKRVTRTGFEDGLFAAWRGDEDFILNTEPYKRRSEEHTSELQSRENLVCRL